MIWKFVRKKTVVEYIEWFKSDPSKSVWLEGCIGLKKSTFRKRTAYYEFKEGTGVLFKEIKHDSEGNQLTQLY